MKVLSLKLDDEIFDDTENITNELNIARNRYINDAMKFYNHFHKRRILKKKFSKESSLLGADSMEILMEFEKLMDED